MALGGDDVDHDDDGNYNDVKDDNCGSDPNSLVVSSPEAPCTLFLAAPLRLPQS